MIKNITIEERIKIKALHDQGYGVPKIAKYIKRHKTRSYLNETNLENMIINMRKN